MQLTGSLLHTFYANSLLLRIFTFIPSFCFRFSYFSVPNWIFFSVHFNRRHRLKELEPLQTFASRELKFWQAASKENGQSHPPADWTENTATGKKRSARKKKKHRAINLQGRPKRFLLSICVTGHCTNRSSRWEARRRKKTETTMTLGGDLQRELGRGIWPPIN